MLHAPEENERELTALCDRVRLLAGKGELEECERFVMDAMGRYPHMPQPHNLMGVLMEIREDHVAAMKHFRAAWALDPAYLPARHNMNLFASFYAIGKCAFDESDCAKNENNFVEVENDTQ